MTVTRWPLAIIEDQGSVVAVPGRKIPGLIEDENKDKTAGLHAIGNHARGEHHRDHSGSRDFKTREHDWHRQRMRVQADVQAIKTQLQLYESMNGFFPTTEQGLQALVTQPQNDPRPTRWYQLFKEMPKDPWGSDYIYRDPGLKNPGSYDLYSAGPDRQADTSDDDWGQN